MSNSEREMAVQRAFLMGLPEALPMAQSIVLGSLFVSAEGQDRPVTETVPELADLCGLTVMNYALHLNELMRVGFVTDDGNSMRIDHAAIKAAARKSGAAKPSHLRVVSTA